jgi:hypothetical protein
MTPIIRYRVLPLQGGTGGGWGRRRGIYPILAPTLRLKGREKFLQRKASAFFLSNGILVKSSPFDTVSLVPIAAASLFHCVPTLLLRVEGVQLERV